MSDDEVMLTPPLWALPGRDAGKKRSHARSGRPFAVACRAGAGRVFCGVKAGGVRVPVTTTIVALNLLLFAGLAFSHGGLLDFNGHALLAWGAITAREPLAANGALLSSMFLHDGLAHLSVNLLFFMLAAPLAERLLGPFRFAFVYLFAGLGAGLWTVGWFPARLSLGASGAVFGVYGSLLGSARGHRGRFPGGRSGGRSGCWCCSR